MSGITPSSSSSRNIKTEIVRLVESQKEKASLLSYFTKHQDQQAEAFSDLGNFEADEDKLEYLRDFLPEQPGAGHIRTRPSSPSNENSTTSRQRKRTKVYHDTVSIGLKADSPSVGANPKNFFRDQQTNPILNGRPLSNTGPPITLYNDAFGQFLNDFSNEDLEIPLNILKWTDKLILEATDSYDNEELRNEKMRATLSEILGTILLVEYGKDKRQKCKCDGVITTTFGQNIAYLGILEGKNEIGTAQNDPTIQGALYYRDYWSQNNVNKIRNCCCAPSFIIAVAGPWFCILGGVFLSRVVVEPLTDLIPLTINLRAFDKKERISRLFYSLSRALQCLRLFYQNLGLIEYTDQRFFPYVRQYQSNEANTISFRYLCELSGDPTRTVWKAVQEDGKFIVVKFTSKYCDDAHKVCGTFAPELLYSSDDNEAERLGGFRMIIMEYINGTSLDQRFYGKDTIPKSFGLTIYRDVKTAIDRLHQHDLVFADLRLPNILIFETDDEPHAFLIDFDWCGEHDVDKYPSSLNEEIPWPPGAEPCALLKKDHDLYWLNDLRQFLSLSEDDVMDEALSRI